jgi:antitoxin (DNA-binding transcriptional repressor) of toxin-antitoxin stability system
MDVNRSQLGLTSNDAHLMNTMTIEEAQAKLPEIIDKLALGEEVLITRNDQPVAKLVGQVQTLRKPRQLGRAYDHA